ncbi:hypothetical protein ACN47E_008859 [Coniothyrium glycines]
MASKNYNAYNYPYQQSSAQQYPTYQTASNNGTQQSRQYQQPATTQAADYMSYTTPAYSGQSEGFSTSQDSSWTNNYGGTRETTNRAAEVLRDMSNTTYTTSSTPAISQPGYTSTSATNALTNRYASSSSRSPQVQAQQTQSTHATYGQAQARPRSVNTHHVQTTISRALPSPATVAGYPSQSAHVLYNQQQRAPSPVHPQYNATPVASARNGAASATGTPQYNAYSHRQQPHAEASRSTNNNSASQYDYHDPNIVAQNSAATTLPPPTTSIADTYNNQSATTVDPTAVYDPWQEYNRKQGMLSAQKAAEDAARAEEERVAEEARRVEEQKKKTPKQIASAVDATPSTTGSSGGPADVLEAEIRAMMAKMRELNGKDPALLARIWEEERRAKAPKSPIAQKSTPQRPVTEPTVTAAVSSTPVANSRKKTVPREVSAPVSKPATPAPTQAVATRPQAQGMVSRPGGNTIWPADKKAHLANAAVAFLKLHNPDRTLDPQQVLNMLDNNPSYIELCQQLETLGFKLDRAAFAKNLLTAVPDVNSSSRKVSASQTAPVAVYRPPVPPAVLKKEVTMPVAPSPPHYTPAATSSATGGIYAPFPNSASPAPTPVLVAEMVPIKPELKRPANKEEAARKRNLSDLVDLTLLSDDDMGPPIKKLKSDALYPSETPHAHLQDAVGVDKPPVIANFPTASVPTPAPQMSTAISAQAPPSELRYKTYVEPLDKKKALRRNAYNPTTIARDVLLACGRHPTERQLNQHLDSLRTTLAQVTFDSDLSTIRWDLIDPGDPPPNYFKDSVQALTEAADDEEDSDAEVREVRAKSQSIGGDGSSGAHARVQPLPEAINPFKQKRRGRPPRQSLPDNTNPSTPVRPPSTSSMSAGASRPSSASGTGYRAFATPTQYGPDGKPLPKKRGRPVGWRKAIHGSATAQAHSNPNGHTGPLTKHQPSQPSSLRKVNLGEDEPIHISSRSPSIVNRGPQYQSYKCKWQGCTADLHNLETLQKHVFKVHRKETSGNTLECKWGDCGRSVANRDAMTNMIIERHMPLSFDLESNWRAHIQQAHIDPLSWELGDGPAGGLSDAHDSDAYLSDAQGRQVTPRITVDANRLEAIMSAPQGQVSGPRGRGRPPKNMQEQEARDAHARMIAHKKRLGGPGIDRSGATLVNDKLRRSLIETDETDEILVDVEE